MDRVAARRGSVDDRRVAGDFVMSKLPKSEWTIHMEAPDSVILGAWEHLGARAYRKFLLIDLPNDYIGLDDLEGLVVNRRHRRPVGQFMSRQAAGCGDFFI